MEEVSRAPDLEEVEQLRRHIEALSAASARVLRSVSRCAELGVFRRQGFRSMTDWLSTVFPVSWATAKEWVLVSRALRSLPRIAETYERGNLTWEQLRPLVRFATPEDDAHWAEAAPDLYPSQLWRERERRTRARLKDHREAHASRYLSRDRDDPVLYLEGRLGAEQGSALEEALRQRSREVTPDPEAEDPAGARRADALVELATSRSEADPPRPTLVVHASAEVLAGTAPRTGPWLGETESGRRLHPETIRRLGCDGRMEWVRETDGRPIGIGRQGRQVPAWLERVLRYRDGGRCRFPGCERKTFLLSHHIRHWANGGVTDLENLTTLCDGHHRLIHEGRWRIRGRPDTELRFHDPTGRPLARASPATAAA
jgi:hypothetical protein